MIPEDNRFESDPAEALPEEPGLPAGWVADTPDGTDAATVERLTELLRDHERAGRGWAGASEDDVLVEVSEHGLAMRENLVVRDPDGRIRAWGSVHDRAEGRMLLVHVVDREIDQQVADRCSDVLFAWSEAQAKAVGAARGLTVQQVDTGAFADDERQHAWLAAAGFERVRRWWQMSRPVQAEEADLVPDPARWERKGVVFRLVRRQEGPGSDGLPDEADLRAVHDVLEGAFTDHFNSAEETFDEFIHRLREDPGHRWDHWWLAEVTGEDGRVEAAGALVGTVSESATGPDGSYVSYLGVLESARGRGVATGLLRTIIADAASRGRDRVGLEVDADSPTGAEGLYTAMGWSTKYVTESWHRDVPVT
ncbi:GNAT family N-acetyltransferase [Nocardioides sp. SYSU D00065]|uniref:GNAT family N-acetyltransferase n=1 Tax=Nocardioides sp. SYSU D00065 TaxID=2817378 RepID=UPI001B31CC2F|nr:GNAT family N-acetyltransferase [Nocardioides sp. SYSU D00065]